MTTMTYVMEEASARKIKVFVLDRPNPIGGGQIEGPAMAPPTAAFTSYLPSMPIRHGLTMGELARLFNGEKKMGADLTVVAMKNWRRDEWFDETGLGTDREAGLGVAGVPGARRIRDDEHLGRARHRHALPADWRAVDRRPASV